MGLCTKYGAASEYHKLITLIQTKYGLVDTGGVLNAETTAVIYAMYDAFLRKRNKKVDVSK